MTNEAIVPSISVAVKLIRMRVSSLPAPTDPPEDIGASFVPTIVMVSV